MARFSAIPKPQKPKPPSIKNHKPFPNKQAREAAGYTDKAKYSQHRQQDIGRAIAMGKDPKRQLISKKGDEWNYIYIVRRGRLKGITEYKVTWNGLGFPPRGVSNSTYSQGKEYTTELGETKTLEGAPDCWTWATWFFVNGIPSDTQWPPVPSKNPNWIIPWPEYPLIDYP